MLDILFNALFRSTALKGMIGEELVKLFTLFHLDATKYHCLHNVLLRTNTLNNKGTTQIDHIFVSEYGVFVLETKNMKGWIFGDPAQAMWTQMNYGTKYSFQNPLRQNYKHIKTLETLLELPADMMHSLVVFIGSSQFKTPMPKNVGYISDCMAYIKAQNVSIFNQAQVQYIIKKIENNRLDNTFQNNKQHIDNLAKQHQSSKNNTPTCQRCGSKMVLRTAKRGAKSGNQFWGCSSFPSCRYTKPYYPKTQKSHEL